MRIPNTEVGIIVEADMVTEEVIIAGVMTEVDMATEEMTIAEAIMIVEMISPDRTRIPIIPSPMNR